jgi:ABC-type bacteriocin/lantibiotic exporter with double-glycine peptidase domain
MLQLYAAIWRVSSGRQIVLILLSLAIAALAAVPLDFQKNIINLLTAKTLEKEKLFLLGAGMLAAILLSLLLKWIMGYRASTLGEDTIRLIRTRLLDRTDIPGRTKGRQGTLATAISAEAEELGKFAGSAFSEPVMQIGTLVSVIGYIASTQPMLGLIAVMMIVIYSQSHVNRFIAERVHVLRASTDHLTAEQTAEVKAAILAEFDRIYETRRRIFIWKLSSKFLLSVINGVGTVAVLMLGGWLVLNGRTDVGTVVAATVGLTRIQAPTAFLIAFYRQVSANRIKFDLLREILRPAPPP